jgi:hypothetical protein
MSLRSLVPRSIVLGWVATIVVAFVVSFLFYLIAEFSSNVPIRWQDLAIVPIAALMSACMSAYVSLGIALICGIPVFYAWRRFGFTSVAAYLFAGALLSTIALASLYAAYKYRGFLDGQPFIVKIAVTIALVAGPVAALTVRRIEKSGDAFLNHPQSS